MAQDPANSPSPSGFAGDEDTRETSRDSLLLVADVVAKELGTPQKVKVRNLSTGGMMADGDFLLAVGTPVVVTLRNIGMVPGTVAWAHGTRFGIAFAGEIEPQKVRMPVGTGDKEAPVYARPALSAPRHDGWNGKLRRV